MAAPRADADIIDIWKGNIAEQLTSQMRVPEFQFAIQSNELQFKGHLRRKIPTPAEIQQINADKQAVVFFVLRRQEDRTEQGGYDETQVRGMG